MCSWLGGVVGLLRRGLKKRNTRGDNLDQHIVCKAASHTRPKGLRTSPCLSAPRWLMSHALLVCNLQGSHEDASSATASISEVALTFVRTNGGRLLDPPISRCIGPLMGILERAARRPSTWCFTRREATVCRLRSPFHLTCHGDS